MKKILLALVLIIVYSCSQKETVKGELFFDLLDFGSFYGMEDEQIKKYDKYLDSVQNSPGVEEYQKDFYDFISRVKKNDLIDRPYVFLRLPSDSVLRIYLSDREYEKVSQYSYWELQRMSEKVEILLEIEKKDEGLYYSDRIIEVNEVEVKTP